MIPLSYNFRSIFRRRFVAIATSVGLGLVVFVFAAVTWWRAASRRP